MTPAEIERRLRKAMEDPEFRKRLAVCIKKYGMKESSK